jgi:hypothetical protein
MSRRDSNITVGRNIAAAIAMRGYAPESVAEGADMRPDDLSARLRGDVDFSVSDVARVGAFLGICPDSLLEGVAA